MSRKPKIKTSFDPKRLGYATAWKRPANASYFETEAETGLRFIGYADEVTSGRRIDHKGWFTDSYNHYDTFRGCVFQLPGRAGASRFISGYQESCSGGFLLDLSRVYESRAEAYEYGVRDHDDAIRDAAYAGDSMAEHSAEKERDYQDAWRAGSDYAQQLQDARDARADLLALLETRRAVGKPSKLNGLVTRAIRELCSARHRATRMLKDAPTYSAELMSAWREGAQNF